MRTAIPGRVPTDRARRVVRRGVSARHESGTDIPSWRQEIVVIGGGLAAARLAFEYREAGGEADVTIVSSDPEPPYNRPPLTKGFLRGELERDETLVQPLEEYEEEVVELRLETTVEAIHPDEHEIELAGGERLGYATLVIATGARPRELPIPGADLVGVHTYRTLADADDRARGRGGGARRDRDRRQLHRLGDRRVAPHARPRRDARRGRPDPDAPAARARRSPTELVELYRAEGVEVLLETEVEELTGNGRLLTGARTKDGTTLEGYLAIVGIGVVPNVELGEAGRCRRSTTGSSSTSGSARRCRDVYAIGDVARYPDPTSGRLRRIEHWSNATRRARTSGASSRAPRARTTSVPVFFTQLFTRKLQVLGDVETATECVLRGSLAEGRLLGFHLTERRSSSAPSSTGTRPTSRPSSAS